MSQQIQPIQTQLQSATQMQLSVSNSPLQPSTAELQQHESYRRLQPVELVETTEKAGKADSAKWSSHQIYGMRLLLLLPEMILEFGTSLASAQALKDTQDLE